MEIAVISDTHIPSRAAAVPEWVRERVRAADHVIHAGDFDSADALATVEDLAADLTAVSGNMDRDLGLPAVQTVTMGGITFVVIHGTGRPAGYERRVADTVREHTDAGPAVGIAGHTHQVLDTTYDGIRLLNPGSATGAAPATRTTMMTVTAADGDLSVEVHEG